jgi:signal transduction histidine kinase
MLGFASVEAATGVEMQSLYAEAKGRERFLSELQRRGRLEAYRTTLRRRDGGLIHVITSAVGHFDAEGRLEEIRGYLLDDTASAQAADALRERQQLFRAVFYDAAEVMLFLDDDRAILEANPAAAALFARPVDQLSGEALDNLIGEPGGSWTSMWLQFLERGTAKHEHKVTVAAGERLLECSYRARVHAGRHLCVARDVTDQRLLAERLERAARIESVGRLAGGIAHDFNNLLTAILGYTELLLGHRAPEDPERDDLLEIHNAGRRAAALTQQLLAFGRKQVLRPRELDLNGTMDGIQPILRRALREDISLSIELASAPALVMIDANQIDQVILNLVLNARDALPAGGAVEIQVARVTLAAADLPADYSGLPGSHVRLRVTDDGIGIAPEAKGHLFEPFFATTPGIGAGLGLASVYGIVQQSGGFITVDNPATGGSVFSLHFPEVTPQPPRLSMTSGGRETILLVENEDPVRLVIGTLLRRSGYHVIEAATSSAAHEIFTRDSAAIDLLLTDVVMPGMNGPALAQRCVADKRGLRVLFISGYSPAAAFAGPFVGFLGKPFQAGALIQAVRDLLDRRPTSPPGLNVPP